MSHPIYDQNVNRLNGDSSDLSEYKGQVLLIVNTASECGFTPQYKGLQKLYKENLDNGFAVLGFPCNQFGSQEPGSDEEIADFCDLNYKITFPLFSKIDVNGDSAHPLFKFLASSQPGLLGTKAIKWNFTKFLISREGEPLKRFSPNASPEEITLEILSLLED